MKRYTVQEAFLTDEEYLVIKGDIVYGKPVIRIPEPPGNIPPYNALLLYDEKTRKKLGCVSVVDNEISSFLKEND